MISKPLSSFWTTIGPISVHVIYFAEGVYVRLYALGVEGLEPEPFDEAYVTFEDSETIEA